MDYARIFEALGRSGTTQNVSTYDEAQACWIDDGKGLMPSEAECETKWLELVEGDRIKAINEEADKRVAEITLDQTQINQDIALAVGLMYAELRSQLSASTQAKLDPIAAKSQQAAAIRAHAAAMIADPNLTW